MSRSKNDEWDAAHNVQKGKVPTALYTDEQPATTIKGTGYASRERAVRTIELTSQKGVRYKQFWTIRAMRERANHHPRQTQGMRDAMAIFDRWLESYEEPSPAVKQEMALEFKEFQRLCQTDANRHSYGVNPSKNELERARRDLVEGQALLLELIRSWKLTGRQPALHFPLTSFVALFGGPGLHGYGKHTIDDRTSLIEIRGMDGLAELIGPAKCRAVNLNPMSISCNYNRANEKATIYVEQKKNNLLSHWKEVKKRERDPAQTLPQPRKRKNGENTLKKQTESLPECWTCKSCTFMHTGPAKKRFLACEICGTHRAKG